MLSLAALGLGVLGLGGCERDPDLALPAEYRQLDVPQARLQSREARRRGRELYLALCALCHGAGADGRGVRTNIGAPRDFTRSAWAAGTSPRRVFWTLREGRRGTAMASFEALSEAQTWDLVAYLLSVAERGARVDGVDAPAAGGE